MRFASFTVDVDCDVNVTKRGCREAISQGCEGRRYTSSIEGLRNIVELLDEMKIKGTFFFEAKGAEEMGRSVDLPSLMKKHEVAFHGLAHEDLTGEGTGIELSGNEIKESLDDGMDKLRSSLNRDPIGFRAPYLHINDQILDILEDGGFVYDSSMVKEMSKGAIGPYAIRKRLIEVPIARARDAAGKKIISYLWPLHEGKRRPEDYLHLVESFQDGFLVIATHSWHPVETYQCKLNGDQIRSGLEEVRRILEGARASGIRFVTIADYVRNGGR